MSLLLEDIIEFLVANKLYDGLAKDAFWDKMPDEPNRCIALFEYQGLEDLPWETDATHRSVQVVCRNSTASGAKTDVTQVYNLINSCLEEDSRIDFNGRFTQTVLRQTPFKIDEDEKNRVTYGFNMGITTSTDMIGG